MESDSTGCGQVLLGKSEAGRESKDGMGISWQAPELSILTIGQFLCQGAAGLLVEEVWVVAKPGQDHGLHLDDGPLEFPPKGLEHSQSPSQTPTT